MLHRLLLLFVLCSMQPTFLQPNMLANLIIQGAISSSISIANQPLTQELQSLQKAFATNNTVLLSQINAISKTTQLIQQATLKQTQSALVGALKDINSLLDNQENLNKETISYVESMNSEQIPAQQCLVNAAQIDQYFTNGTMNTPRTNIWKDVFQIGFWQYNPVKDSFWQTSSQPWFNGNQAQLFQNSIFTEWTCKTTYKVQVQITIYHMMFPSFVGIMFGKNRWISGDMDGMQRYATIGLLASTSSSAAWCFAQPTTTNNVTSYPADALTNGTATSLMLADLQALETIENSPLEYTIALELQGQTVRYKIWATKEKEPQSYSVQKLQATNDVNLFQGIGFLSAGALAEFKLLEPKECVFSSESIEDFNKHLASLLSKQGA